MISWRLCLHHSTATFFGAYERGTFGNHDMDFGCGILGVSPFVLRFDNSFLRIRAEQALLPYSELLNIHRGPAFAYSKRRVRWDRCLVPAIGPSNWFKLPP